MLEIILTVLVCLVMCRQCCARDLVLTLVSGLMHGVSYLLLKSKGQRWLNRKQLASGLI